MDETEIMSPKLDGPFSVTSGQPYEIFEQPLSEAETHKDEIFNTYQRQVMKQPPESRKNSKLEQQKKVIFDKFREIRLNEIR